MPRQVFALVLAPLLGLFIMALGSGFLTTLVPLTLSASGVSVEAIGYVTAAYYIGLCLGAVFNERLLLRIGFIRSYACFAAIVAATTLAQALWIDFYSWLFLRLICGWATVGVYLVIESWLLTSGESAQRGRILAFYMISYYAALALGQLLLGVFDEGTPSDPALKPFILIGMLAALSLLPVAILPRVSPTLEAAEPLSPWQLAKLTPTGVMGSFGSGILMGGIYSLLPLYLQHNSPPYSLDRIGTLMAIVILGGMALQYPIGRWSDRHDRQRVLIAISILLVALALLVPLATGWFGALMVTLFLLGGGLFALYPVSMSHSADRAPPSALVGMTQGMLLINSLGSAVAAPLLTPLMARVGNNGLFVGMGVILIVLVGFFIWRRSQRPAPMPVAPFSPTPAHSAVGAELTVTPEMIAGAEQAEAEDAAHEENAERDQAEVQALDIEQQMAQKGTPITELPTLRSQEPSSLAADDHAYTGSNRFQDKSVTGNPEKDELTDTHASPSVPQGKPKQ
ncbi:putative MFS-type transporter YcaD [Halomonadaceae bacterium LMG 33818]|uniref:MFS transporter n=1 Tax=Cernens ardua TaxID=3402176 RepID=UPI003EDC15AE